MAEEGTAPVSDLGTTAPGPAPEGQTTGADSAGVPSGQATDSKPTTEQRTSGEKHTAPDDSFTDPSELPPELQTHYKRMQGAFTKKMQKLSQQEQTQRQKLEAYDAFATDPVGSMQRMAAQYGYRMSRADAQQALQDAQQQPAAQGDTQQWQPQTWDEVLARAEERAERRILERLAPVLGNVQEMRAQTIERQLDEIDPEWRTYEDDMRTNIQTHPTLVKDVAKLYRLSVPDEVIERRATQKALKKFESKAASSKPSASTGPARTAESPPTVNSFDDAVRVAKQMLAQQEGRR